MAHGIEVIEYYRDSSGFWRIRKQQFRGRRREAA